MSLNSRERTFFVDSIEEVSFCGAKVYQLVGSEFCKPTDFLRMEYEKHNLENCENCKENHAKVVARMQEEYKRFPGCCVLHAKLPNASWFDRADFDKTPQLYADKLYYTWHHIVNYIDQDNWHEEIIDFIEYILNTFGSFPNNYGEPLFFGRFMHDLIYFVDSNINAVEKKAVIIQFIKDFVDPPKRETDLNVLLRIYDEWYNTFPFELSFLAHLKDRFEGNAPIIQSMHNNKYLGLTKTTLTTKERLIDRLLSITNTIITQVNTATLYRQGVLTDLDQAELDLILQKRLQKLKQGYNNQSKDPDTRYRKILKAWLKDELQLIKDLKAVSSRSRQSLDEVHQAVMEACYKMQENKVFWTLDENARTRQILDLVSHVLFTKDQSQYGMSESGKKPGEVDGVLIDKDKRQYFIEAFNLEGMDRTVISRHINKLEYHYDSKGLTVKYVLVYCNVEDGKFTGLCQSYYQYLISGEMFFQYTLKKHIEQPSRYTNTRQYDTIHEREGQVVTLRHILIKMPVG